VVAFKAPSSLRKNFAGLSTTAAINRYVIATRVGTSQESPLCGKISAEIIENVTIDPLTTTS
jgi:hypothetical protein